MAHVLDVARYILERQGETSTVKLQKLVYYAQVWSIVDLGSPMFSDHLKAWAQGPVVPALFQEHKGRREIGADDLVARGRGLTDPDRDHLKRLLDHYGQLPAAYLSALSHFETPWRDARATASATHQSPTISLQSIRTFYSGKSPAELEAAFQRHVATKLMDEHAESLARLAL